MWDSLQEEQEMRSEREKQRDLDEDLEKKIQREHEEKKRKAEKEGCSDDNSDQPDEFALSGHQDARRGRLGNSGFGQDNRGERRDREEENEREKEEEEEVRRQERRKDLSMDTPSFLALDPCKFTERRVKSHFVGSHLLPSSHLVLFFCLSQSVGV